MSPLKLRIRQERRRRGWTQQELADRVGVRRATISDLERRAVRRLDMGLLERLAKALRVPTKQLIE